MQVKVHGTRHKPACGRQGTRNKGQGTRNKEQGTRDKVQGTRYKKQEEAGQAFPVKTFNT